MKIIFLDIDGVLCTTRAHIAQGEKKKEWHMTALDREGVGLLNAIHGYDPDNTRYVLSSTWRKQYSKEYMENHLKDFGWTGQFHDDWKTNEIPRRMLQPQGFRGAEVADWLERNEHSAYVIFDDGKDFLPNQMGNFVNTDHDYGISLGDYEKAMQILHGKKSDIYLV